MGYFGCSGDQARWNGENLWISSQSTKHRSLMHIQFLNWMTSTQNSLVGKPIELDLSHAYEQMLVDEDSKTFLTINPHKGLYRYNRLPYGAASAPGIFQRMMEGLLQGIPRVGVLLDNVLITGTTSEEQLSS